MSVITVFEAEWESTQSPVEYFWNPDTGKTRPIIKNKLATQY